MKTAVTVHRSDPRHDEIQKKRAEELCRIVDKSRVNNYLSMWGYLRRVGWRPKLYSGPSLSGFLPEETLPEISDELMQAVFHGMSTIGIKNPQVFAVLELIYYRLESDRRIGYMLDLADRTVKERRLDGQKMLMWYLDGWSSRNV